VKRQTTALTRAQIIILSVLGALNIVVIGGLAILWLQTGPRLSTPEPTPTMTLLPQNPVTNIRTFLEDPDVSLTPGELRSIAFGQQIRIYWAIFKDNTRARFEVNQQTGEVIGFLRLGPAPQRVMIDRETAQATALAFAEQHYRGFVTSRTPGEKIMQLVQATGALWLSNTEKEGPKFYSFQWVETDPNSGAMLPSEVRIWVNAETGQVDSYDSLRIAVTVSTQPQIDKATAYDIALEALGMAESAPEETRRIEGTLAVSTVPVHEPDGNQALLWRVVVEHRVEESGDTVKDVVFIDAHTGEVVHIASLM
jgi:hypothetical protein